MTEDAAMENVAGELSRRTRGLAAIRGVAGLSKHTASVSTRWMIDE